MENASSLKPAGLAAAALFALCAGSTYMSYRPTKLRWDDSDYLYRSIEVSRGFWSGNLHRAGVAMVSWHPPAMTLLGLPWGPLPSWGAAGNCFITLASLTSLLAATSLYLLLRIGVRPVFLALASLCVFASLGPYPGGPLIHGRAVEFLADSLVSWTALLALLLIPFEARTPCRSAGGAVARGILCAAVLSFGAMTKVSFFYFIGLIVPALFFIRLRRSGPRITLVSLASFVCCSAPAVFYWLRYGQPAFAFARSTSFGRVAEAYYNPFGRFLAGSIQEAPGLLLSFMLVVAGLLYAVSRKGKVLMRADLVPILIAAGYAFISLSSPDREFRLSFPAVVALPFLIAVLLSGEQRGASFRTSALAAGVVLCGLLAAGVPTRHRADSQSLDRANAVLAEAVRCHATHVLLATDSPFLNNPLMALASEFSTAGVTASTLAYRAAADAPIEEDFGEMRESGLVVLEDREALYPAFSNRRVPEYERYIRQTGVVPVRVADDVLVYPVNCRP